MVREAPFWDGGVNNLIISLRPTDFGSNLPTPNLAILDAPKYWCQCSLLLAQCSLLLDYIWSYLPAPEYLQMETHPMLTKSLTMKITIMHFKITIVTNCLLTFSMKTSNKGLQNIPISEEENYHWSTCSTAYVIASFLIWLVCFYPLYNRP